METLSTRALCTLADVKVYSGIDIAETEHDDLLKRLINAASSTVHAISCREFKADGTNPQSKTFDAFDFGLGGNFLEVGDMASTPTAVSVYTYAGTLRLAADLAKVDSLPRPRSSTQPITHIRIRELHCFDASDYITVTGAWGFPAVPEDIRQATIVAASAWFARDVANYSRTFSLEADRIELPQILPAQVMETVLSYKIPRG